MKLIVFLSFIVSIYSGRLLKLNEYPKFIQNKNIYSDLNDIVKHNMKNPVILNGVKTPFKMDLCKIISEQNNVKFKEYTFDTFITELPHVNNKNSLLYINDFLIKHGRILNHYEENILFNLHQNSNLIVFNTENLNTVPFKDINIIRYFKIYEFPEIDKREIIQYCYDNITVNNYDSELYNLDWITFNIEKLDFEKINILMYLMNNMFKKKKNINVLNENVNNMIDYLYKL